MSYVTITENYGGKVYKIDLAAFCADLAPLLGGTAVEPEPDRNDWQRYIAVDGMLISASQRWNSRDRAVLRAKATGIEYRDMPSPFSSYGEKFKLPEITVAVDRPLVAIAKDVKRRLVEPAAKPLNAIREYAADRMAERNSLSRWCAEVEKAFPGISQGHIDNDSAMYRLKRYGSFKVYANGKIQIERLPDVSIEVAKEIIRLTKLNEAE